MTNVVDGNGVSVRYEWDGTERSRDTYKDGERVSHTGYYSNGQKKYECTYKDGKLQGLTTWWYENGQKHVERTYKDGKLDGLLTMWYKNGQKEEELTFKADKKISRKEWDKDGNQTYPKP